MYLLDTNVVSMLDPSKQSSAPTVVRWIERNGASLYLSVMTIAELDMGVLKLQRQKKAERSAQLADFVATILARFASRVLPLDLDAARRLARMSEHAHRQPVSLADLVIAATAARHGLTVLTRNVGEFARLDIAIHDPFTELPPDA